jgi:hypothetical protein
MGACSGAAGRGTALQAVRSRVRSPMWSLEIFIDIILNMALASRINEQQEYFLGGKGGRCARLTPLPPSRAHSFEIWERQPPGTLSFCPRIALPL